MSDGATLKVEDFVRFLNAVPHETFASGYGQAYLFPSIARSEIEAFAGKPDREGFDELQGWTRMRWDSSGYIFIVGRIREGIVEEGLLYRGTPLGAYL